ncbi:MAG: amino acid permease [Acidobacteria bacterium]|nr:amino acid permease [Acidobacteriota bacterium]
MEAGGNLKRQFGLWTAVALLVGQVIAVGIFLTPAGMAKAVGSPFWLLLIWLLLGAMTLSGALCYAELAARFPEAGGSYVYLREIWGRPVAFLYGWMDLLVLDPGLTATFAVGATKYLVYLVPLGPAAQKLVGIGLILVLGTVNILGARIGANVFKALTVVKIGTLVLIILYGFLGGFGNWDNFRPFFAAPAGGGGAVAGGLVLAFFAFAGWWEVTRMAGEVENPGKNLPRALSLGIAAITVLYVATSAVFMYLVPLGRVADDQTFAAQAGAVLFGPAGGAVFAGIVVLSVLVTMFAYLLVSPRVYFAMARDGLFFRSFGRLHPRFGTPHRATLVQMTLAVVLVLTGTFEQIIGYFFFVVVFFIALTAAGIFRLRKTAGNGYRTPFYPATPLFFLVVTGFVLLMIALRDPVASFCGVAVVLAGLPVYYLVLGSKN